jgi:hypothetical protein
MVKILFRLRKLPSLTTGAFQKYWYEVHAPLVKKHQKVWRIARYVQLNGSPFDVSDASM